MPTVDIDVAVKTAQKIHEAITAGLIESCHDCSEGGLAVALAEMAFAGGLGVDADLNGLAKDPACTSTAASLFSESNSRYIIEVTPENHDAFAKIMLNVPFGQIAKVVEDKKLTVTSDNANPVIDIDLDTLKAAWQKPLDLG